MRRRKVEGRLAGEFSKARNKEAPQAGPQLNLVSSPFQKPGSGGARAAAQIYHRTEQRQIPRRDLSAVASSPQIISRYYRFADRTGIAAK